MKLSSHTNTNTKNTKKVVLLWIAVILTVFSPQGVIATQTESKIIGIDRNNLSVNSAGRTLAELLNILRKNTGIDFTIQEQLMHHRIYVKFSSLPMDEALKKIFKGKNVSFIYGSQDAIEQVVVFDDHIQQEETVMLLSQFREHPQHDEAEIFGPYPELSEPGETMITEPAPVAATLEEAMNITSSPQTAEAVSAMRALGVAPPFYQFK